MLKEADVLDVGKCGNLRSICSGHHQLEFADFGIAGDEVVVVHPRTLSLSGYFMLECEVVETL